MEVALVSPFDPFTQGGPRGHAGGVERVYAEVARTLAARGHTVTVVCSSPGLARRDVVEEAVVERCHRVATLLRAPLARLARRIPETADVLQVAATYPFATAPALRWAARRGVPAVLDFHFEPRPPGPSGRLAASLYRRTAPRAYASAAAVLVRSPAYAEASPSLRGVPSERLRVVPNGVDPARFRPAEGGLEDEEGMQQAERGPSPYLLFVGRLVPYKGLDVLLDALRRHPPGLPLVVAGEGPLRRRLERRARRVGVPARFLGHVPDGELPGLYRGARLTVLPSVNGQEAFGISLLESMACGTPVVASDLPGVADVALLGGRVAPPRDAEALGRCIRDAAAPGALVRGRALADGIRRGYSWDAVARRLEDVYREVVDGSERVRERTRSEVRLAAHPGGRAVL